MDEYKYSWKPSSALSIDEFLKKYKPTTVLDDGTKPWIWVRRLEHEPLDSVSPPDVDSEDKHSNATVIERAQKLLEDYTEKIASIQKDESIPIRANKKKGLRSKKEVREEIAAEATKKLKEISQESKLTCGKLLFFSQAEHIDGAFSRMARELTNGALSKTSAFCLKVATTPMDVLPNHRYLICLYLPDIYDKVAVAEVLRTVCQSTGIRPNSAKTDLYTVIGLDSKHPSGIKSTVWNPTDLIPDAELKALTEAYWNEANKKVVSTDAEATSKITEGTKKKTSKRPRKQESDDDLFDDVKDATVDDLATVQDVQATEDSATESESDETPTKPATSATGKSPLRKPTKSADDSSSDEDNKKPKKIRKF
ncbi:hypothetical protein RSOLAG1IB_05810 [Rhizoctonia solani AG-1 IB]|uniref:Uncharacterized protein n=1 Tax=Thanatephorus cucumeris (strain AG1-IB / isolate 7/3/14) TaxID=1108050 RepID=A0A0B7F519_THACB|nr:hypothetical protein RSOLAG1IB_05810 [Rhizoctonia solani AG-1 IB]